MYIAEMIACQQGRKTDFFGSGNVVKIIDHWCHYLPCQW